MAQRTEVIRELIFRFSIAGIVGPGSPGAQEPGTGGHTPFALKHRRLFLEPPNAPTHQQRALFI